MFGFRVTYLRGCVTAADVRRGNQKDAIEWPPHPDRLFCALVQAWGDLGEPEGAREALLWLERLHEQKPPLIRFSDKIHPRVVPQFVPVNDTWKPFTKRRRRSSRVAVSHSKVNDTWEPITKQGKCAQLIAGTLLGRIRQPRQIPTAALSEDTVVFWWRDVMASAGHRASLSELAAAVASLGHSSSLVHVEVVESLGELEPTLVPHPSGNTPLRIPTGGRLDELCEAYRASPRRRPPLGRWANYGLPVRDTAVAGGYHRDLIVFSLRSERPPLPLEVTGKLTSVWRKALLSHADQPVCEAISGHAPESTPESPKPSQRPHLALLTLADVGHRFARSHLLGVAAALPANLSAGERRACLRALGRVDRLTLGELGIWRLERLDASETRHGLQPETWRRPSRAWATVTPVVFGRYPKDLWGQEAAGLIREACAIAGLPEPCQIRMAPVAWVLGVPPAHRFPALPSRPGKPRRAHTHLRLVFPEPVAGPLLVGAGRHQGYGLFRQVAEEAE